MSTCCKRGCCCCCNKRDLTVLFGFILAAIAVSVPIVIHETDQDYGQAAINLARQYLAQNEAVLSPDQNQKKEPGVIVAKDDLHPHEKYK